jgi:pilus assembly protein CpaF
MESNVRQQLYDAVIDRLRGNARITPAAIRAAVTEASEWLSVHEGIQPPPEVCSAVTNGILSDVRGFGPIQVLMDDPDVTEIMVNGPHAIYAERGGRKTLTGLRFKDEPDLRRMVERLLMPSGRRVDESLPYADFALDDGSRVHAILPPLSMGGATVTIRKFLASLTTTRDLVRLGTLDGRMADFLDACIRARINILFSGPTGSGKTTTVEILSAGIDPQDRIITIEDAPELSLRQHHVVRLLTRPPNLEGRGEVTIRILFKNTLRMRPTRIILGEIRGEEALDYLQAQTSGHRGCLAVIHAASPTDAIARLETLALYAGVNLPPSAVRQQIASGLQLVVQHEQLGDGRRVITHITEIAGMSGSDIQARDIFSFTVEEALPGEAVRGRFEAHRVPDFYPLFRQRGVTLDARVFT